jgi:putative oxidoreductase
MNRWLKTSDEISPLLIRLAVGLIFFSEGVQKFLYAEELGSGRFAKIGIPSPELLGPFVGTVEICCGLLVLVGLGVRFAAVPLLIIMLVAITATKIVHIPDSGFWEFAHGARTDFAMLLSNLFLIITGAGRFSIDHQLWTTRKS